ncbi:DUF563 domain-containing protein [Xylophilus sp. Kf1]|nr:DUF563 domain-containing protein [Xylophilus sp. Kf1]
MDISLPIEGIKPAAAVCRHSIVLRPPIVVKTANREAFLDASPGLMLDEFAFEAVEIHSVRNAVMLPTGAVVTHDGWVVAETLEGSLADNGIIAGQALRLDLARQFQEPVFCTAKFGTFNYSVFLHEVLPAIYVAGTRPDMASGFTMGYADFVGPQQRVKFEELYAPFYAPGHAIDISATASICNEALIISAGARRSNLQRIKRVMPPLVSEFALSLDPGIPDSPERIYVMRERKSIRELENRENILAWARHHGFVCVELAHLSFSAQASYFRHASVIFAEHGAGLANLWHCRPGVRIFEIFPDKLWGRWLYRGIASLSGFDYAATRITTPDGWVWNRDPILLPTEALDAGLAHYSL